MKTRWFELLRNLYSRRELLFLIFSRDLRARYLQTRLGLPWLFLEPVLNVAFYFFVLDVLLRVRPAEFGQSRQSYLIFLLAGLLAWNSFTEGTIRASQSLLSYANIVTKVVFPVELLPVSAVLAAFFRLAVGTSLLILVLAFLGLLSTSMLGLVYFACCLAIVALGLGYFLAVVNAWVRDLGHVLPMLFSIWLYLSPVLYPASIFPQNYRWVLRINPLTPIFEGWHACLLPDPKLNFEVFAASFFVALAIFTLGTILFARAKHLYSELI